MLENPAPRAMSHSSDITTKLLAVSLLACCAGPAPEDPVATLAIRDVTVIDGVSSTINGWS